MPRITSFLCVFSKSSYRGREVSPLPHPPTLGHFTPRKYDYPITVFHILIVRLFENLTTIPNNFQKKYNLQNMYLPCLESRLFSAYFQKVPTVGGRYPPSHTLPRSVISPLASMITQLQFFTYLLYVFLKI